jgi:2-polyprenyl-3-methyl-5-hydroxy-6-metoxy-1,4-benzoquinol methylase
LSQFYSHDGVWSQAHEDRIKHVAKQQRKVQTHGSGWAPKRPGPRDLLFDALSRFLPVNNPAPGSRALDFGCGDGKFLDRLQDRGWETFGIEPSTDVAFARHRRLDEPPGDGSFHLIVLHQVLEHVPNPLDVLTTLARSLRSGGVLFITVPNLDRVAEHGDMKYCINGKGHIVAFTTACLQSLCARSGLSFAGELDPALHALTDGKPLRLRVVAIRADGAVAPPVPLGAAMSAIQAYERAAGRTGAASFLPVRVRGALLDRRREQSGRRRIVTQAGRNVPSEHTGG